MRGNYRDPMEPRLPYIIIEQFAKLSVFRFNDFSNDTKFRYHVVEFCGNFCTLQFSINNTYFVMCVSNMFSKILDIAPQTDNWHWSIRQSNTHNCSWKVEELKLTTDNKNQYLPTNFVEHAFRLACEGKAFSTLSIIRICLAHQLEPHPLPPRYQGFL